MFVSSVQVILVNSVSPWWITALLSHADMEPHVWPAPAALAVSVLKVSSFVQRHLLQNWSKSRLGFKKGSYDIAILSISCLWCWMGTPRPASLRKIWPQSNFKNVWLKKMLITGTMCCSKATNVHQQSSCIFYVNPTLFNWIDIKWNSYQLSIFMAQCADAQCTSIGMICSTKTVTTDKQHANSQVLSLPTDPSSPITNMLMVCAFLWSFILMDGSGMQLMSWNLIDPQYWKVQCTAFLTVIW